MQENPDKITFFAQTNSRGNEVSFGIKRRDRARHMYIIGKTGMGKSTLLENMAIQDIRNGEGMAFIDPHGQTADRILEYVPEHRIKDVVYFAPFDMEYPIAFNVMEDVGYDKRHLVVSGLMSAFKKLWVDAWSARMEYILSNTLLALLEFEGSTLLDVNTMYTNKAFRKRVVDNVKDPVVKRFWTEEFANFTDRFAAEATPAIQNKVGQFTSNPLIRNIIGQSKSSFDIRALMDQRKILIINLSKGRVGEINAALLGSMLVTKIYLAAMSRADVPATTLATLPSFYFYVDEFQNFANESFSDILSEARKYKLNLIIAHQYIEQMEEEVRDAVFGNVGTTVAFRVGPFDAEVLETVFQPQFTQTDLVNLGFAQIYLTLMIDGVGSPPFSATTMKPFDAPPQMFVEETLANSRRMFAKPRQEVEDTLAKWQESEVASAKPLPPKETRRPVSATAHVPHKEVATKGIPLLSNYVRAEKTSPKEEVREPASPTPKPESPALEHKPVYKEAPAPRPQPERHPQRTPEKPPLVGAKSLREALDLATSKKTSQSEPEKPTRTQPQPATQTHTIDLKATLNKIVSNPTPQPHTAPRTTEIPEKVLQEMLAVEELPNENA